MTTVALIVIGIALAAWALWLVLDNAELRDEIERLRRRLGQ